MPLWIKSLASGSSANSMLVQSATTRLFVDCGTAMRQAIAGMEGAGFPPGRVEAVLLTHEHSDHIRGVGALARRLRVPVAGNRATLAAAQWVLGRVEIHPIDTGHTTTFGDLQVTPFPVPHDSAEAVGYLISDGSRSVCLATDVGHLSSDVLCALRGADLIVLEANHDREMLRTGPYPAMLKRRIMGGHGHLANPEAAAALVEIASGSPQWVWLAHLSAINNTPSLALRTVVSHLEEAGVRTMSVCVAQRDLPSVSWSSDTACCQLPLL